MISATSWCHLTASRTKIHDKRVLGGCNPHAMDRSATQQKQTRPVRNGEDAKLPRSRRTSTGGEDYLQEPRRPLEA